MAAPPLDGILATIGNTPLVELRRLYRETPARVYAKIERANPGGSLKDRTALSMLSGKVRSGELVPGRSVVVESSSGNLAIGLAQFCRYFGLRFICVVDAKTTEQNLRVIRAYGAEVEVVTEPDPSGEFLPVRLSRVRELLDRVPHAYWPNQYANPLNPRAHERTMREIDEALDGRVDYLLCATGSTGTLNGCAGYVRAYGLPTKIVAVDAVGSVLFGPSVHRRRLLPGHGSSVLPDLFDPAAAHEVVHVDDLASIVGCRRLMAREAILAGGSSGAMVAALDRLVRRDPAASYVLILPDGGDRYLNTIYSDVWVNDHFGDVAHLWKDSDLVSAVRTESEVGAC